MVPEKQIATRHIPASNRTDQEDRVQARLKVIGVMLEKGNSEYVIPGGFSKDRARNETPYSKYYIEAFTSPNPLTHQIDSLRDYHQALEAIDKQAGRPGGILNLNPEISIFISGCMYLVKQYQISSSMLSKAIKSRDPKVSAICSLDTKDKKRLISQLAKQDKSIEELERTILELTSTTEHTAKLLMKKLSDAIKSGPLSYVEYNSRFEHVLSDDPNEVLAESTEPIDFG